jgi:hypothetical protein
VVQLVLTLYPAPAVLPSRRGHPTTTMRIPHPITVTQAVTSTRGGRLLILLGVGLACLQALGWAEVVPKDTDRPATECVPVSEIPHYSTVALGQTLTCRPVATTQP